MPPERAKPRPVPDEPVTKAQLAAYRARTGRSRGYSEVSKEDLEAAKARTRARRAGG